MATLLAVKQQKRILLRFRHKNLGFHILSFFLAGCSRSKENLKTKTVKKDTKQPSISYSSTSRSSNSSSLSSTDGQTSDSTQTIPTEEKSDTDATGNGTTFSTLFSKQPSKSWMAFESESAIAPMAEYKELVSLNNLTEARIETTELGLETKPEAEEGSVGYIVRNIKREREDGNRSKILQVGSESKEESPGETSSAFSHGLEDALAHQAFVVSDATKPDCPIVCASTGFLIMTGYSSEEVIGRNCRFLRGPETDKNEVVKIRDAIKNERSYCGRLLNYRKNGSSFWNLLTIAPIRDDLGKVILFIGMQVEVKKYNANDKPLHPNELLKSPISQASLKESVLGSITEVVQTELDFVLPESAEAENINKHHRDYFPRSSSYADRGKISRLSRSISFKGYRERSLSLSLPGKYNQLLEVEGHVLMTKNVQHTESLDYSEKKTERSHGIDLATALERFEKNFVITDPRLPDNPIIFASDSFLKLTEYSRKEILGRNCRFLQGVETDQATVSKIRDAIKEQKEITVQLLNYTKSGKKFWNLFHLQPVRHQKGDLQYFIGVQLDVSSYANPLKKQLSDKTEQENIFLVRSTAEKVDEAVRKLPNAHLRLEELLLIYSQPVFPRPHKKDTPSWVEIQKITARGEKIGLHHFKPIKPLGYGDAGSVHLVELEGTCELYAVKAMKKSIHRACTEREIISLLDHPFLPTLYSSFQTPTHLCLVTDFYPGGELFDLLDKQPMKMFNEESASSETCSLVDYSNPVDKEDKFYAAEVVVGLEYLHCLGIIYRDLKPENILLQKDGHVVLTDFDLSLNTSCKMQIMKLPSCRSRRDKNQPSMLVVKPVLQSSSFVGTEEYIAPEIIAGKGYTSSIDWWSLGILLYEMLYGITPFKGKDRQETFSNILQKDVTFPSSILVSLTARQFIKALLQKDPAHRLGSITGAIEIKQHPFFQRINWPLIRCMTPPPLEVPLQVDEWVQKAKILTNEEHPPVSQHRLCKARVTNEIVHTIES